MNKFFALTMCAVSLSSPAMADGLKIDLTLPVVHGGVLLDVDTGVTVGVTVPVVGGGAKVGLLTPTDAIAVRLEAPVVHKAVAAGCCVTGIPYAKPAN